MKIVFLEASLVNPGDISWDAIKRLGEVEIYDLNDRMEAIEVARDADILVVNKITIDADFLSQMNNLKYICEAATGYDNIDLAACKQAGIPVSNVKGYSTESVAQHVFAMLLHYLHRIDHYDHYVKSGSWTSSGAFSAFTHTIESLHDKILGIWGYGNIGKQVAVLGRAFGMKILVYHHHPEKVKDEGLRLVSLEELLATADVFSIHVPKTEKTAGKLDREMLSKMKPEAILINAARGGIVVEEDLYTALKEGVLAAALLDVLEQEPPPADHLLLTLDNCIITPHQAWTSLQARQKLLTGVNNNIKSFQEGKVIGNLWA